MLSFKRNYLYVKLGIWDIYLLCLVNVCDKNESRKENWKNVKEKREVLYFSEITYFLQENEGNTS